MSNEEQFFNERPQVNILRQFVNRFLPFWPVFIFFTAVSLFISYFYLRSQTKIYVATAKVLLKDPSKSGSEAKLLEALNIFSEKKVVDNEIVVMRSSSILREVVKDLDLYVSIFNKGNVQTEELFKPNSPVWFVATNKDSIRYGGSQEFDVDWDKHEIQIAGKAVSFNGDFELGGTTYKVVPNVKYRRGLSGKNYFAVFYPPETSARFLGSAIKAAAVAYQSTVIDVNIETPVKAKGVAILDKLFEVYNAAGIREKNQMAVNTINFIEDRLATVIRQLDSVENKIKDYKARYGITDLGAQASLYFNKVNELDKMKSEVELRMDVLSDLQGYVNSKARARGTVPAQQLVTDPQLTTLLNNLYTAEFELDAASAAGGEKSTAVILGEEKVSDIKKDINENIRNIRNSFEAEKRSINNSINLNNSLLKDVPTKELALLDISRQQSIFTHSCFKNERKQRFHQLPVHQTLGFWKRPAPMDR